MSGTGLELGVDLGTSNTVAVARMPDGRSRTLLFDGSPLLPSAVYAEPGGAVVVGRDAVHSARLEPARFEPNPKRRIDDTSVLLGDREIPVVHLLSAVLARVGEEFRRTVGGGTPTVTITCPASWGATRRLVLSDAATHAGLGAARLVPEPVAAATYFTGVLGKAVPVGSVVVVHDFGAGTFDASVVARTAAGFEVLAVDGRDDLGGLDIDETIIGFIRRACEERDPVAWQRLQQPSTVDDRRARRLLWDDVRVAKERLSRQPAADLTVPLLNVDLHLTREELEALAQPTVEQTIRVTQGVMRWAKVPEGRVAGVFLVGGSSRMPLVATLLHRALNHPPVVIDSPELVVAEGSLLATAAAQQPAAGPAPGPLTGVMPRFLIQPDGNFAPAQPVSGPSGPVSGPPGPAGSPGSPVGPPVPVGQAVPVVPGSPVSGPVSAPPVSAPPVSGAPVSASPISSPPVSGSPTSSGSVYISGRASVPQVQPQPPAQPPQPPPSPPRPVVFTRPMPRTDQPPQYREPAYREPAYREPAYRESAYRESAYREPPRPAGASSFVRTLKVVLTTILLITVPLIAAYVAYKLTVSEPLLP